MLVHANYNSNNMFILRTIHENSKGETLSDNWHEVEDFEDMVDKVEKIDPDKYQCFDANEITNEVFIKLKLIKDEREKNKRKKKYEELKKEFG